MVDTAIHPARAKAINVTSDFAFILSPFLSSVPRYKSVTAREMVDNEFVLVDSATALVDEFPQQNQALSLLPRLILASKESEELMKRTSYTLIVSVAALLGLAGSALADATTIAKAHSEAFAKAMKTQDVDAVLALYAEDARIIWPGEGDEAKGKDEIRKVIERTIKSAPPNSQLILKSQDSIPLSDGYVANIGKWEQTITDPKGKTQTFHIRTSEIIRHRGGKTVYIVDHASIGAAPPSAPAQSMGDEPVAH